MTTVTGLTAARMLDIEQNSIVDGSVVGDNLILEKQSGTTIDAGDVRGPEGPPGSSAFSVAEAILAFDPSSFWKLNEPSGNFADSSSTPGGVPLTPGAGATTRHRRGYRSSQSVLVNADTPLGTAGDVYRFTAGAFSLLCLHRTDTIASVARRLACKCNAGETIGWEWIIGTDGKLSFFGCGGAPAGLTADNACTVGEYNMYGYSNNGVGEGRIYQNGVYKAAAHANVGTADASAFRINGITGDVATRGALGVFDCFAIWAGYALNQANFDSIWAGM